jgi:hypothetical protein
MEVANDPTAELNETAIGSHHLLDPPAGPGASLQHNDIRPGVYQVLSSAHPR